MAAPPPPQRKDSLAAKPAPPRRHDSLAGTAKGGKRDRDRDRETERQREVEGRGLKREPLRESLYKSPLRERESLSERAH
jgi:hypothetical protein